MLMMKLSLYYFSNKIIDKRRYGQPENIFPGILILIFRNLGQIFIELMDKMDSPPLSRIFEMYIFKLIMKI